MHWTYNFNFLYTLSNNGTIIIFTPPYLLTCLLMSVYNTQALGSNHSFFIDPVKVLSGIALEIINRSVLKDRLT